MLDKAKLRFRRWFAKVWKVRGGGFYACGFIVTFIYLEIRTIAGEFVESSSIGAFLSEQLIEFVFRFAIDSLINTVYSFVWPVYFIQLAPPYGLIGLGLAYLIFANVVKEPLTRWLFPDDAAEPATAERSSEETPNS